MNDLCICASSDAQMHTKSGVDPGSSLSCTSKDAQMHKCTLIDFDGTPSHASASFFGLRNMKMLLHRFVVILLTLGLTGVSSLVECSSSTECESSVGSGSECREGSCSYPFEAGCLRQKLPWFDKMRVCNSDDQENSTTCRKPDFDQYMEIRIYGAEWESRAYISWLLQIMLSEVLGVPTTVDSGVPGNKLSFYDPSNGEDFGINGQYRAMERASAITDCRFASRSADDYEVCSHFAPEVWDADLPRVQNLVSENKLEPPQSVGMIGSESWYATKFTIEKDPSLATYLGLQGDENRRKLADTFLRPTTWQDYCEQVSPNSCTSDDGVAKRAPNDEKELERMFVEDVYTGHFRATEENDCDLRPDTCTGHIVDYPCAWSSFLELQAHHLNIPLVSSGKGKGNRGYSYSQMLEIWHAANATKSNVMIYWW